jgi:hypothetical protein
MRTTLRLPKALESKFKSKSDDLVVNTILVSLVSLWVAGKVDISEEYKKEVEKTKEAQRSRALALHLGLDIKSKR